jgi:anti-sigma B factor antagonist
MSNALALTNPHNGEADELPPAFVCSWTDGGRDAAWVHVTGDLDLAAVPQLEWTLREAALQARLVVLDLRELGFLDSAGVKAIVDASIRARRDGRRLLLLRGPPNVDRVFALTGTSDKVEIGDLDPGEPAVRVLLQLAEQQLAS